ncbi:MAG: mechanosensitive ion channel family protein [Elusimicrobia bacterium]|nr:mechanosensitive ion channel family protein [Elusimicrobiota bacterium]
MTAKLQFILASEFLNNTVLNYFYAVFFFAAALAALYFLREIIVKKLKTLAAVTKTDLDDLAVELISTIRPFEYQLIALYIALRRLNRTPDFDKVLSLAILLVFSYRAAALLLRLLNYWIDKTAAQRNLSGQARNSVVYGARVILKSVIWVAAGLFVLTNLGVNVTAVLAGLGIGGIAVALAAQAILGDIFNFFVILLDKPFTVGDFITSDAVSGTVEHVGLKSTRIRSLSGEIVIISNSNLLASRIRNYKDLNKRRVAFKTAVIYSTAPEKLKKIPGLIKDAVGSRAGVEFERSNLADTGDFSLDFETVYHINTGDYRLYMDTQEQVLLGIIERFNKEGIVFAVQTVLINK